MPIYLYAEVLLNIRSVSLYSNITSRPGKKLITTLTTKEEKVTLECDEETTTLIIPGKFAKPSSTRTSLDSGTPRSTQSRLAIADLDPDLLPEYTDVDQQVPWSASTLPGSCAFYCRSCHQPIVPRRRIQQWKDLPSANWADMMDFWHCHKPPQPNDGDSSSATDGKGYAAGNVIRAESGIGLVDPLSFLLNREDCSNVQEVNPPPVP